MTLEQAISLATRLHEGQRDKAGAPYIGHPRRVMERMTTTEEKRVAVLHDVMEDCGVGPRALLDLGLPEREVRALVALTKRGDEQGGKKAYMRFIRRAGRDPLARKVKLGDLEDNLDASRLGVLTSADRLRLAKYRRAKAYLLSLG